MGSSHQVMLVHVHVGSRRRNFGVDGGEGGGREEDGSAMHRGDANGGG